MRVISVEKKSYCFPSPEVGIHFPGIPCILDCDITLAATSIAITEEQVSKTIMQPKETGLLG